MFSSLPKVARLRDKLPHFKAKIPRKLIFNQPLSVIYSSSANFFPNLILMKTIKSPSGRQITRFCCEWEINKILLNDISIAPLRVCFFFTSSYLSHFLYSGTWVCIFCLRAAVKKFGKAKIKSPLSIAAISSKFFWRKKKIMINVKGVALTIFLK